MAAFKFKFMIQKPEVACSDQGNITSSLSRYVAHYPFYYRDLLQAKRYFREGKDKKTTGEITDLQNPVFTGQIFAEMLAGICHKEFYRYSDQEVSAPLSPFTPFPHPILTSSRFALLAFVDNRRSQYSSLTLHSNYITLRSHRVTGGTGSWFSG
jgi:hypothetical protein